MNTLNIHAVALKSTISDSLPATIGELAGHAIKAIKNIPQHVKQHPFIAVVGVVALALTCSLLFLKCRSKERTFDDGESSFSRSSPYSRSKTPFFKIALLSVAGAAVALVINRGIKKATGVALTPKMTIGLLVVTAAALTLLFLKIFGGVSKSSFKHYSEDHPQQNYQSRRKEDQSADREEEPVTYRGGPIPGLDPVNKDLSVHEDEDAVGRFEDNPNAKNVIGEFNA